MLFRELNRGKCKTYLIGCEKTRRAAIVDPVRDRIDRYLAILAYHGLALDFAIDTHTHADHRTGCFELHDLLDARVVMHRRAPAPRVDLHVEDGDRLEVGELRLEIRHTPGHTPDGIAIRLLDRVLTGDTLLIRGTGRSDFAGGDAGQQYDSIQQKLFPLPDGTLMFPAHDYRGNTSSTIGEEKRLNPRLAGKSRDEYVELMGGLGLPLPDKIQEVLQPNQSAVDDERLRFPDLAQLNQVRQRAPKEVWEDARNGEIPLLLDVREPAEFAGELGHVPGSRLIPLRELPDRVDELADFRERRIVAVCRAGVRSTTAAALLTGFGFEHVENLRGGMLEWNDLGLPVER